MLHFTARNWYGAYNPVTPDISFWLVRTKTTALKIVTLLAKSTPDLFKLTWIGPSADDEYPRSYRMVYICANVARTQLLWYFILCLWYRLGHAEHCPISFQLYALYLSLLSHHTTWRIVCVCVSTTIDDVKRLFFVLIFGPHLSRSNIVFIVPA